MDTYATLITSLNKTLKDVAPNPITIDGVNMADKFQKPKMRAQVLVENPPAVMADDKEGEMMPLIDAEVEHCAAVIATAFLNPISVTWDYNRFTDSKSKRKSETLYVTPDLGLIAKPATFVDRHGRIFLWYLPGLLLPFRVEELNRVSMCLKKALCDSSKSNKSWRMKNFTHDGEKAIFGAGKLSLSIGRFQLGHILPKDQIYVSRELKDPSVQSWLQLIAPVEQLLDAVQQVVHPEMWSANSKATSSLVKTLDNPSLWPTIYAAIDVISNRITPRHRDSGGANTLFDNLLSFGQGHDAKLELHELHAKFAYEPGTSVLFSGKAFYHAVTEWSDMDTVERMVMAHYSKDAIHDRLGVARPSLPTQSGWWSNHQVPK